MKLYKLAIPSMLIASMAVSSSFAAEKKSAVNKQEDTYISKALQTKKPQDVVYAFLMNTSKAKVAHAAERLVATDAGYVSLSFDNPELKQIEPWAGSRKGRQIYVDTFSNVGSYWNVNDFKITNIFSEGENVAVFGTFDYTSVVAKNNFTSPFSILAKVKNGQIVYFQFMEDTYASAASFRVDGQWTIQHKEGEANKFTVGKNTGNTSK